MSCQLFIGLTEADAFLATAENSSRACVSATPLSAKLAAEANKYTPICLIAVSLLRYGTYYGSTLSSAKGEWAGNSSAATQAPGSMLYYGCIFLKF
jgi:hypothetical protein